MSIGDIGGKYHQLQEVPEEGAQKSTAAARSPTAQKVREATTKVMGSLTEAALLSQKLGKDIGQKVGKAGAGISHASIVSLQKGFGKVHQSISSAMDGVFHFIDKHIQKGKSAAENKQDVQNMADLKSWFSNAKANNKDLTQKLGPEKLKQFEDGVHRVRVMAAKAHAGEVKSSQFQETIAGRIADYKSKLSKLETELQGAVQHNEAFTSTGSAKVPSKALDAKSYKTLPNTGRNLDKELKVLQNAIKGAERELAAFERNSAKLLGTQQKAANKEGINKATASKGEQIQQRKDLGAKIEQKQSSAADVRRQNAQAQREKMKAYGEKVRAGVANASGEVPTARRALSAAEARVAEHEKSSGQGDKFEKLAHTLTGERLKDRVDDKKQTLGMVRGFEKRNFGSEQTIDNLQFPRNKGEFGQLGDRIAAELSDEQIDKLIKEGQKAAGKAEITYPKELSKEELAKRKDPKVGFSPFAATNSTEQRAVVRELVSSAFSKAIQEDERAQKEIAAKLLEEKTELKEMQKEAQRQEYIRNLATDAAEASEDQKGQGFIKALHSKVVNNLGGLLNRVANDVINLRD